MEFISLSMLVSAISAALVSGVKDVSENAVKDAYSALKSKIGELYGQESTPAQSMQKYEDNADVEAYKGVMEAEFQRHNLLTNDSLQNLTAQLIEALQKTEHGRSQFSKQFFRGAGKCIYRTDRHKHSANKWIEPEHRDKNSEAIKTSIGKVLFNPHENMHQGKKERVEVRVSAHLDCFLTESLKGEGPPRVKKIKVTDVMTVALTGSSFEIVSHSTAQQMVDPETFTEWIFDVTPLKSGQHDLILKVSIHAVKNGEEKTKDERVLEETIHVKVNRTYATKTAVKKHWKVVIVGTGVPILGLIAEWAGLLKWFQP